MAQRYSTGESIKYYSKKHYERQTLITQDNSFTSVTFTCNICNESVKSAMFLNCLHSFCTACVDEKLKASKDVLMCMVQPHLTCPLCPEYDNLSVKLHSNPLPQLVTSLKAIRCKVQNDEVLECQDCVSGAGGKRAVSYCIYCKAMICEIDLNSHKKYRMGHNILDLENLKNFTVQQMLEYLKTITLTNFPTIIYKQLNVEVVPQHLNATECIKEANDKIAQLEASKLKLENAWDSQVRQVVTFYEDLQKEIEQRRATRLQELSDLYQELMAPLEKCIQHLEQTISYTQYIAALKNYDYIAGLQGTTDYKLSDISDTVANFKLPPIKYTIQLFKQDISAVTNAVNNFMTVSKENVMFKEIFLFKNKRCNTITLNTCETVSEIKVTIPVAIAIDNSSKNNCYVLFDSYINHYQRTLNRTIKLRDHTADISHSAMTVTADSIVILISNHIYLYSKKDGQYKSQLTTANYGYNFTYPKMYFFPEIPNYFYTSSLLSQMIYLVNTTNGANQGSISYGQNIYNICTNGTFSLTDIALCPTDATQIVILCSCNQNVATAPIISQQVTYYIQIYDSGTNFLGIVSLNQQLSPFCCFILRKDELYLLDASTGQTSVYDPQNYIIQNQNYGYNYNYYGYGYNCTTLNKIRTEDNSFNKATDLEGKLTKDYPVQAFSAEQNIILFCGGNIQIIM